MIVEQLAPQSQEEKPSQGFLSKYVRFLLFFLEGHFNSPL